jgi:heme/copper-type cytochrome/quinol oxidase subunit 4
MTLLRPLHIWALLVSATVLSWFLAEGHASAKIATTAIILIAAFKINLVISHFMELKWQPRPYRLVLTAWLALVATIIIGGYWAA